MRWTRSRRCSTRVGCSHQGQPASMRLICDVETNCPIHILHYRLSIPPTSRQNLKNIARRMSRIFGHAYSFHREVFEACEVRPHPSPLRLSHTDPSLSHLFISRRRPPCTAASSPSRPTSPSLTNANSPSPRTVSQHPHPRPTKHPSLLTPPPTPKTTTKKRTNGASKEATSPEEPSSAGQVKFASSTSVSAPLRMTRTSLPLPLMTRLSRIETG